MDSLHTHKRTSTVGKDRVWTVHLHKAIPFTVCWTHTCAHSHTHFHTHTDISKEAEWNVSVYLCERRRVINQVCVSASDQSHLLIVTERILTLAIKHAHAWFPSDCQANFTQTSQMSQKIRCELSDSPSSGMKMNISGKKKKESWDSFKTWLALGKLLLCFSVS